MNKKMKTNKRKRKKNTEWMRKWRGIKGNEDAPGLRAWKMFIMKLGPITERNFSKSSEIRRECSEKMYFHICAYAMCDS